MTQEKTEMWGRRQQNKNISETSPVCLAQSLAPYICFFVVFFFIPSPSLPSEVDIFILILQMKKLMLKRAK